MDSNKAILDMLIDLIVTNAQKQINFAATVHSNSMENDSVLSVLEKLREMVKAQSMSESLYQQLSLILDNLENLQAFPADTLFSSQNYSIERLRKLNESIETCTNFLDRKIRDMQTYLNEMMTQTNVTQQNLDQEETLNETSSNNDVPIKSEVTSSRTQLNERVNVDENSGVSAINETSELEEELRPTEDNDNESENSVELDAKLTRQTIAYEQLEKLVNIPAIHNNGKFLKTLLEQLNNIFEILNDLDFDTTHLMVEVVLRSKLPWQALDWVYLSGEGRNSRDWSIDKMLRLVRQYADLEEEDYKARVANRPSQPRRGCVFCGNELHSDFDCSQYQTIERRKGRLQELNICDKCLKPAHGFCRRQCSLCLQKHHRIVCPLSEDKPHSSSSSADYLRSSSRNNDNSRRN